MKKKLTKAEKDCILQWLANTKGDTDAAKCDCPFVSIYYGSNVTLQYNTTIEDYTLSNNDRCMVTCGSLFKKVKKQLLGNVRILKCPCYAYPVKYVRKQAKKWVCG